MRVAVQPGMKSERGDREGAVALMDDIASGRGQGPARASDAPATSLDEALNQRGWSASRQQWSGAGARAPGLTRYHIPTLCARFFPHDGAKAAPIQRPGPRCDNAASPESDPALGCG
jgi:hypothetical protein